MRKTIIFIILLSVIGLFGDTPTNEEYSSIDDIVKYYSLYKKIDMLESNIDSLNARCLCLEQKVKVLEMAVEYEVFDDNKLQKHDPSVTYPVIDPIQEEFWRWQIDNPMPYMPAIDPQWERFIKEREAKEDTAKHKISYGYTRDYIGLADIDSLTITSKLDNITNKDINKLTKEMNHNYDDVMDEILMLWEAIYKIQDGK